MTVINAIKFFNRLTALLNTKVLNDHEKQPHTSSAPALWKTREDERPLEYGRLNLIFDLFYRFMHYILMLFARYKARFKFP